MESYLALINLFSANFTKCSNTLKQFVGNLPANCLSVFDHFVRLALKVLTLQKTSESLPLLIFTMQEAVSENVMMSIHTKPVALCNLIGISINLCYLVVIMFG